MDAQYFFGGLLCRFMHINTLDLPNFQIEVRPESFWASMWFVSFQFVTAAFLNGEALATAPTYLVKQNLNCS